MIFKRPRRRPIFVSTYRIRLTKKQRLLITAVIFAVVVLALYVSFNANIQPVIIEMAKNQTHDIVTTSVHNAIDEKLTDGSLDYEDLITLQKDDDGNITALTSDISKINTLQAEIVSEVISSVSEMGAADLKIPIGNIIGGNLMSGRGPGIPIKIISLPTSSAEFDSEFMAAGINQTKHRIVLHITVDVNILVPGKNTSTQIVTDVLIAETIIVGTVPDSYLNVG